MSSIDYPHDIQQTPAPGVRLLQFQGDTLTFALTLTTPQSGTCWLRTNLGQARTTRREVIRQVEKQEPPLGRDWFDLPMEQLDDRHFSLTVPLLEVGHAAGKCFFLPEGESTPVWPAGDNTIINIEPAASCGANIIYNTFVRQFGPNKTGRNIPTGSEEICIDALDQTGYTVIPPSGTFRDLIGELDFIIGELGCRVIQLLPIHPTPTTYARMGRFGSPYAALSFTAIDPALAVFDPHATPLEQFGELVDAIHARQASLFIDIAPNHTGWAANLHETHPEWLVRDAKGRIEVPGAWGVNWEDLTKLDYRHQELWQYMANVFLTWCQRGVDGFRCDAGYMIPHAAWKYLIAKVREQYPKTIFLLEGLGGKMEVTEALLDSANFNWAYSELFQNYDRSQISTYLPGALGTSCSRGIMVHFAETHDNNRLADRSTTYARMRTALCALCAPNGAFAFANGVEWYATEKINVHDAGSLNWGAEKNQVDHIRQLNAILMTHPAFYQLTELTLIQEGEGNCLVLHRRHQPSGKFLLVVVNLEEGQQVTALWQTPPLPRDTSTYVDLLTGATVVVNTDGGQQHCTLAPGQVLCLSPDPEDLGLINDRLAKPFGMPPLVASQCLQAKALEIFSFHRGGDAALASFDALTAARQLAADPEAYGNSCQGKGQEPRITVWQWPRDLHREVMVPPNHSLLVQAAHPFRARLTEGQQTLSCEESLPTAGGTFFALFLPRRTPAAHQSLTLALSLYTPAGTEHLQAPLRYLTTIEQALVKRHFSRTELLHTPLLLLSTNGRGGMLRTNIFWDTLNSRYDALLAANLNREIPVDRQILFSRCRAWLVFQGYSQTINGDCLDSFSFDYRTGGRWHYTIPTGQGEHVAFAITFTMLPGRNAVRLQWARLPAAGIAGRLADDQQVELILRPDIEDRSFHETTKAFLGAEHHWPAAVEPQADGFIFSPTADHRLVIRMANAAFTSQPEWHYMVYHPREAERGLDPDSDLFSPGYFSSLLTGGQVATLSAEALAADDPPGNLQAALRESTSTLLDQVPITEYTLDTALALAIEHYLVKRGSLQSVVAGYPWFLDWGRDSLIVARGLIAAGKLSEAKAIIQQFGRFEERGTLPNAIHGNDAGNRDTSDAPLWFLVDCAELVAAEGSEDFLATGCGGRTIRDILFSIGTSLITGTANGVKMDHESGLIFSPAHFTWMDTNHPAGTPREGYPIEIQALWRASLVFLAILDPEEKQGGWSRLTRQVEQSIVDLFWLKEDNFFADCLHTPPGNPARKAEADDALRPNQLLTITLGAVSNPEICQKILAACAELLVPGAIRSLADRPVRRPLAIIHRDQLLNNPQHPYQGEYSGDEDSCRKPAYHNGTAWTWLFPNFCEAWAMTYGRQGWETASSWMASSTLLFNRGCIGQLPEITDGNAPHRQRGCDAQAWGVSELLRVFQRLQEDRQ
ncbi:MAG: glycogen debranching enzyme N-terminal domain-containing protein [Deltaproteobacteria bacterium]|nr:glycogen debranching enzyme N-terminal domain-containing protein [Candidatus Anaeroferrophillus wilburensis]MBN2888503.1 glycogen debranching enzyme N-terminal domain-containing protein [Deltaproteobacteria bacterium]